MKRFFSYLIIGMLIFTMFPVNSAAAENSKVTYLENGCYIVETLTEFTARSARETTGTKARTYYNSDGTALWKAVLTGTFTYDGTSATCTSASVSVTVYDSGWYTISKSASKSGNTASATVTMGYKTLGVTTDKVTTNLTLSCDKDGNLS